VREADKPHQLNLPNVMEMWETKPPGPLWDTPGLLRDSFTFYLFTRINRMFFSEQETTRLLMQRHTIDIQGKATSK
jgi:hypothetical protein